MDIKTVLKLSNQVDLNSSADDSVCIIEVRANEIEAPDDLFIAMATAFQFPAYFGYNWAALDECFSDYFVIENGGLGSEFGDRRGIAAEAVHLFFGRAGGLLRHGPNLVERLTKLLTYTQVSNEGRRAADLTVTFQVENERERVDFEAALGRG